jgi:hypothetical protein
MPIASAASAGIIVTMNREVESVRTVGPAGSTDIRVTSELEHDARGRIHVGIASEQSARIRLIRSFQQNATS